MKKIAVAYCRYSSDKQREESISAQIRAIEYYASENNYEIIRIYKDEAQSGVTTENRDEFQQMIQDSKNKSFEIVLVHKLDRFSRNQNDHAIAENQLKANGVEVVSVMEQLDSSTPESIILKSVILGMNEYYSRNLSREVKKGLYENAKRQQHAAGHPPLGLDIDENKHYIINENEAIIVRKMFDWYLQGIGLAKIAEMLNEEGYKNKKNRAFRPTSIRDHLLNMKYIGTYTFGMKDAHNKPMPNPIIQEDAFPAIISKEIFYKVQERFQKRIRGPRKRGENYLLTGLCICGECGGSYSGGYRCVNRNKSISYGYMCQKRHKKIRNCKNKPIRKELIEKSILDIIRKEILTTENIEKLVHDFMEVARKEAFSTEERITQCENKIKKLDTQLQKLLDLYVEGSISKDDFLQKKERLETDKIPWKSKLFSLKEPKKIEEDSVRNYLLQLKQGRQNEKLEQFLIRAFVYKIIIHQNRVEAVLRRFPLMLDMGNHGGSDDLHCLGETICNLPKNLIFH